MDHSSNFLKLFKTLGKLSEENLGNVLDHLSSQSLNDFCTLVHNIEYCSDKIPTKLRTKVVEKMRAHRKTCQFLGNKANSITLKRNYIRRQKGSGLFPLKLAAGIPLLVNLIAGRK